MRDIMALVVVAAILVALIPLALPGVVFGATSDNLTGQFTLGNSAPTVNNVTIYETNRTDIATSLTPLTEYSVKVTVADANQLSDLSWVKVTVFWDETGTDNASNIPADNTMKAVTFTCTVGTTPTWGMNPSSGTTWVLMTDNCTQPSLSGPSGDFFFNFKPGKVATEKASDWNAYGQAQDTSSALGTLYETRSYAMNWYGGIDVTTTNATWTGVTTGMDFDATNAKVEGISVNYIANGDYRVAVTTDSSWGSAALNTAGIPTANQFSLKANNVAGVPSGNLVTTSTAGCTIDNAGVQTTTDVSGLTVATNALYLKLGAPFVKGTYSGQVCYTIIDR